MTRINVVPPQTLTRQHLQGEYKEITRVFTLARNAYARSARINAPTAYTLGKGHVLFFYKRIGYIAKRYTALVAEMRARGYHPKPVAMDELLDGIPADWMRDYTPTAEAVAINQERIEERLG